jgi:hypothetical protein
VAFLLDGAGLCLVLLQSAIRTRWSRCQVTILSQPEERAHPIYFSGFSPADPCLGAGRALPQKSFIFLKASSSFSSDPVSEPCCVRYLIATSQWPSAVPPPQWLSSGRRRWIGDWPIPFASVAMVDTVAESEGFARPVRPARYESAGCRVW